MPSSLTVQRCQLNSRLNITDYISISGDIKMETDTASLGEVITALSPNITIADYSAINP